MKDIDIVDRIRKLLPEDTTPIGNHALIRELAAQYNIELTREDYYRLRQKLIDNGEAAPVAGGYGGRIRRLQPVRPLAADAAPAATADWSIENRLYPPFERYLKFHWPRTSSVLLQPDPLVAVTADNRSGYDRPWSIPDLIVLDLIKFRYLPGRELELHSFELKTASTARQSDVYQALAYGAFAHYSHLVWHVVGMPEYTLAETEQTCRDHNVGFITFTDPREPDSYQIRHMPERRAPSLRALDEFIDLRLDDDHKQRLTRWLKG